MSLLDDYLRPVGAAAPRTAATAEASGLDPLSLIGNVGSGLSYAGGVLDKPGRMARGLFGGEPQELLNIVPFSDTMGLTDPTDRVSGNDLLGIRRTDGFIDELPGLGVEILLDPLTYAGGIGLMGKLGKAGKAVKSIGGMDDILDAATRRLGRKVGPREAMMTTTLRELPGRTQVRARQALGKDEFYRMRDNPLGGMFSLEIPGFGQLGTFGKGQTAQRAARGLDTAGKWLKGTAPVRGTRMLFDTSVMGRYKRGEQELAEQLFPELKQARQQGTLHAMKLTDEIDEPLKLFKEHFGSSIDAMDDTAKSKLSLRGAGLENEDLAQTAFHKVVRLSAEMNDINKAFDEILPGLTPPPQLASKMEQFTKSMVDAKDAAYHEAIALGFDGALLDNFMVEHFPRYIDETFMKKAGVKPERLVNTRVAIHGRDPRIRHLPAEIVNRIVRDPDAHAKASLKVKATDDPLQAAARTAAMQQDQERAVKHILEKYGEYIPETNGISKEDAAAGLAEWANTHPELLKYQQDLFPNPTTQDFIRNYKSASANLAAVKAVHKLIRQNVGDVGVPIEQVYKQAGMNADRAMKYLGEVSGKYVPSEVADAVLATVRPAMDAEWAETLGNWLDKSIGIWKAHLTVPFPAFHTRNLMSGQYMNMVSGDIKTVADVTSYGREFAEVNRWWRRGQIPRQWEREMLAYGVLDPHNVAEGVPGLGGAGMHFPMEPRSDLLNVGKTFRNRMTNLKETPSILDRIPGAKTAAAAGGTMMDQGAKAAHGIELLNRAPMYLYLRKRGWSPAEAAKKVLALQVDYRDRTGFETKVMKRLVPFYSFTRKISETQMRMLLDRPGGAHGQAIRAMNTFRGGEDELVPSYISQQLSIPVGPRKDGTQKFLTGFGLPQEDMFGLFRPGATLFKTLQGTGEEFMGRVNPMVKVPFEVISGRQLFSGRNLEDLRGVGGDILYNAGLAEEPGTIPLLAEQLLSNSPAARYLSTTRTVLDPRKQVDPLSLALQLGSGVRFTHVDMDRAQGQIIRDAVTDMLRPSYHFKHFEKIYPEKGMELTPREQALWDLFLSTKTGR